MFYNMENMIYLVVSAHTDDKMKLARLLSFLEEHDFGWEVPSEDDGPNFDGNTKEYFGMIASSDNDELLKHIPIDDIERAGQYIAKHCTGTVSMRLANTFSDAWKHAIDTLNLQCTVNSIEYQSNGVLFVNFSSSNQNDDILKLAPEIGTDLENEMISSICLDKDDDDQWFISFIVPNKYAKEVKEQLESILHVI